MECHTSGRAVWICLQVWDFETMTAYDRYMRRKFKVLPTTLEYLQYCVFVDICKKLSIILDLLIFRQDLNYVSTYERNTVEIWNWNLVHHYNGYTLYFVTLDKVHIKMFITGSWLLSFKRVRIVENGTAVEIIWTIHAQLWCMLEVHYSDNGRS